jgi:penicillin-binding protein 2
MSNDLDYTAEEIRLRPRRSQNLVWEPGQAIQTDEIITTDSDESRYPLLKILFTLTTLFMIGRLFQLQVAAGQQYRNLAEGNSIRTIRLNAERGLIFDHQGALLTRNAKRVVAVVTVENLPRANTDRQSLLDQISQIIPLTTEVRTEIDRLVTQKIGGEYQLATNLTKQQHLLLKELSAKNSAVSLVERPMRQYETTDGLAHLLGYVGQVTENEVDSGEYDRLDQVGKNGLERSYEERLRGQTGIQMVEVDAHGSYLATLSDDRNREAQAGDSLRLAIDTTTQRQVAEALRASLTTRDQQFPDAAKLGGTVVVMEANTGRLRALVSLPDYDNNLFARGITSTELSTLINDARRPLVSRANYGLYPPGSTIKPLVASGALYYKIVSPSFTIDTPPLITVGGHDFPDWKDHGVTNIRTAIAESNNIFFYMLGGGWEKTTGLGLERLQETVHWFGYERKTGIDLPGEEKGYYLSEERKEKLTGEPIYLGDVYHVAIGQGDIGVTPLQVATATATIANGGTVYQPRIVEAYVNSSNGQEREVAPTITAQVPVKAEDLAIVRDGMRQAVLSGSSRPLSTLTVNLAGKTGTAQFGNQDLTHAWFTGYGPAENPQYVVTVLIEGGGGSFEAAVPLAESVFRIIFNEPKNP